jgi:multidrug efflux pump
MTPRVCRLTGVTAIPITPPSLGQGFTQRPINFVIITSESYQNLAQTVRAFQDELAKNPGFVQVDTDLRLNKPEITLRWTASARPTWVWAWTRSPVPSRPCWAGAS